jgi:hypothetical protein
MINNYAVLGDDMTIEWVNPLSTGVTAVAGIAATFFTARYSSKNNLRVIDSERRYQSQRTTLAERKSIYVRMLHSLEEFYHILAVLHRHGYGNSVPVHGLLTEAIYDLLTRNLEIDLSIQSIEREMELVAPFEVIAACRRAFFDLREKTQILVRGGEIYPEPYETLLAQAVALMRLDLQDDAFDFTSPAVDDTQDDMRRVYDLNAPVSAIEIKVVSPKH